MYLLLKRKKYLVLVGMLMALLLTFTFSWWCRIEKGVRLSFVTKTSKPLVFKIAYTADTKTFFSDLATLNVSVPAGEHKTSVVLPVSKLARLRVNFGKDCEQVILSGLLLQGKSTVHLNNLAEFSIGQITSAKQEGDTFTFYSRRVFPYIVYKKNLDVPSKWFIDINLTILLVIILIGLFVFYKLISYIDFSFVKSANRADLVFLTVFFAILFLPMLCISRQDKSEKENRMLASFVSFIQNNQLNSQFGVNFEKWYNDHFGGRNMLIGGYNYLVHTINRNRGNDDVFIGKEKWLFRNAPYSVDIYRNNNLFTEDQLREMGQTLAAFVKEAKKHGVKEVYFYLSNDKETLYPEYYPYWIKRLNQPGGLEQIYNFLKEQYPDIKVLNFKENLQQIKQKGEVLFLKTDTHMTPMGSFYEYSFLMQEIKKDFPDIKPLTLENFTFSLDNSPENDLFNMLNLPVSTYGADNFINKQLHLRVPVQAAETILTNNKYYQHLAGSNPTVKNNYKLTTLNDSFLLKYKAYLMETFKEVDVYFWGAGRPFDVPKEDCAYWQGNPPDILLVQTTDRCLYRLLRLEYPCVKP